MVPTLKCRSWPDSLSIVRGGCAMTNLPGCGRPSDAQGGMNNGESHWLVRWVSQRMMAPAVTMTETYGNSFGSFSSLTHLIRLANPSDLARRARLFSKLSSQLWKVRKHSFENWQDFEQWLSSLQKGVEFEMPSNDKYILEFVLNRRELGKHYFQCFMCCMC